MWVPTLVGLETEITHHKTYNITDTHGWWARGGELNHSYLSMANDYLRLGDRSAGLY